MKEESADLTAMSSVRIQPPTLLLIFFFFLFFLVCCPFAVSWWLLHPIGEEQGVDGVSPCDPALIILFIKCLFN